jgi:hypothetical protein
MGSKQTKIHGWHPKSNMLHGTMENFDLSPEPTTKRPHPHRLHSCLSDPVARN